MAENLSIAAIGVELDALQVHLAARAADAQQAHVIECVELSIPPAALVPRFAGEAVAADLFWPPHPRGSGESWPPEARLEHGCAPGRLPIALAWPLLESGASWTWPTDQRDSSIDAADAIAEVLHATLKAFTSDLVPGSAPGSSCGLIVPTALSVAARSRLSAALDDAFCSVNLIDRAIAGAAACRALLEKQSSTPPPLVDSNEGCVLMLHMGLEQWEATIVAVAERNTGRKWRLIEPRIVAPATPINSYGLELMHRLAVRALEMSYRSATDGRLWELIWCTPWMASMLRLLRRDDCFLPPPLRALAPHVRTAEFAIQQTRHAAQQIFGPGADLPNLARQFLQSSPDQPDLRDWTTACRKAAADHALLAAVATGPMALMPHEQTTLGEHYVHSIWPRAAQVMIEGRELAHGCLASGAALATQVMQTV